MAFINQGSVDWFAGQLLVAMPGMVDPRFSHSVVYMCAHNPNGAMGLIINRPFGEADFPALLRQLGIDKTTDTPDIKVHFGGPVEVGRGFVLHSSDYVQDGTTKIDDMFSVTATLEIMKAIAEGHGPEHCLMALGYAGWGSGQLEQEVKANGWLTVPADDSLVFDRDLDTKWNRALAKIGVNPTLLSTTAGQA